MKQGYMKWQALFVVLVFNCTNIFSQVKSIEGVIMNTERKFLPGATVRLLTQDSIPVSATTTNTKGKFRFTNISTSAYVLSVSYVGYKTLYTTISTANDAHSVILPAIFLLPEKEKQLDEIVVTAKRPLIQQDIDKTVVNVEAIPGSSGSNAYELLGKSPGVIADENGNIALNGKANILVLIDGRQVYMSGQDLATYLKSLPGVMLDKIELVDNPAARYDAAGGAVINIRLKKSRQAGLTGNVNAGVTQGRTFRTNESLNLNYNAGKVNWFGNAGYSRGANYVITDERREYFNAGGAMISVLDLYNKNYIYNHSFSSRLGFDYSIFPKTTIGMQLRSQLIPRKENYRLVTDNYDNTFNLDSVQTGSSGSKTDWKNYGINFNFQQKFKENINELLIDLNYIRYSSDGERWFHNDVAIPGALPHNTEKFEYRLLSGIKIYNFKADYTHELKSRLSIEAGVKLSLAKNNNDSRHYNMVNNVSHPDYGQSNHFLYDENINAGYISARRSGKRWGVQAGLRVENTVITGNQLGNPVVPGSRFTQNFTDFFPSIFFNYKPDSSGKNNLNISYTNRIIRPGYQLFNPFMIFRDHYSSNAGNPALKPVYRQSVELVWQHRQFLSLRTGIAESRGLMLQVMERTDSILITRPVNLSNEKTAWATIILNYKLRRWWTTYYWVQFMFVKREGIVNNERFSVENFSQQYYLNNIFSWNKDWTADFGLNINGRELIGSMVRKPRFHINASIQKKMLKNKGTVLLGAEDIFHTWKSNYGIIGVPQVNATQLFEFDSQRVRLTFSYRFGDEKFLRKRRHNDNAADPETGRVQ
ncbi:MAG: outer membrane beta-barrel protein [Chitinophagaceae bacterium]|nr:outer membrane beta-barrel protein [Chitinophagaceae bacterium]MCW5925604.1 outer membrane beta-barrel protein [Chitinophagaceae bacterium]